MDTVIYISNNTISQALPVTFEFDDFLWAWGGFDEEYQRNIVWCSHPEVKHKVLFRYILPDGVNSVEDVLELDEFIGSEEYPSTKWNIPPQSQWASTWWSQTKWNPFNWFK